MSNLANILYGLFVVIIVVVVVVDILAAFPRLEKLVI